MPQYADSPRTNEQHSTFSSNESALFGIGKKDDDLVNGVTTAIRPEGGDMGTGNQSRKKPAWYFYCKFKVLGLPAEHVEGTEFSKKLWSPY